MVVLPGNNVYIDFKTLKERDGYIMDCGAKGVNKRMLKVIVI